MCSPTGTVVRVVFVTSPVSVPSRKIRAPSGEEVTRMLPVGTVRANETVAVSLSATVTVFEASA